MTDDVNAVRAALLETLAEELETTLLEVVKIYNRQPEFKRRIDLAALNMSCPISNSIH